MSRIVAERTCEGVCVVCSRTFTYTWRTSSITRGGRGGRQTCSAECLSVLRQRRREAERQRLGGHCRPETAERIATLLLHDTTIGSASHDAVRQAEQRAQKERLAQAEDPPAATCPRCGAPASVEECPVWGPDRLPCVRVILRCGKWRGHAVVVEERILPQWRAGAPDPGPAPPPPFLSPDQLPQPERDLAPAPEPDTCPKETIATMSTEPEDLLEETDELEETEEVTLPDMAAQLLEWMPHLLALPEEEADLVVRLARAEARRRSA